MKPKQAAPALIEPEEDLDDAEAASGIGDDDVEEEREGATAESGLDLGEKTNDPTVRGKQQQLRSLHEDLKVLQEQCDKLKKIGSAAFQNKSNPHSPDELDQDLEYLLGCVSRPATSRVSRLEDHPLFKKNTYTYLTLFSPSDFRLTYQCWQKTTKTRNSVVYQTTFAAPQPWPPNTLNLTFDVFTDQQTGDIEDIVFANNRHQPPPLQKWIEGRLSHPVFKTDLATIFTGIGRYFEEDTRRATIIKHLTEKLASSPPTETEQHEGASTQAATTAAVPSRKDALSLLPYLDISQRSFSLVARSDALVQKKTRHSLSSAKQLMLTYDISLDWIGQTGTAIDVCASGFSTGAVQNARKMFRKIEVVDGVKAAFEGVWKVLGMDEDAVVGGGPEGATGKRKVRRMTEFNSPVKQ